MSSLYAKAIDEPKSEEEALVLLRKSMKERDRDAFLSLITVIDWQRVGAEMLNESVSFAVAIEAVKIARGLADTGQDLFPDEPAFLDWSRVLAPAEVLSTRPASGKALHRSGEWLSQHRQEYPGQWVAVHDGQFLGAAQSLKQLLQEVGELGRDPNTLVTKVSEYRIPITDTPV